MVNSFLTRLLQLDQKLNMIDGMEGRAVGGSPKFKKTGLHLSATLLTYSGFSECYAFRLSVPEAGKLVLEKV